MSIIEDIQRSLLAANAAGRGAQVETGGSDLYGCRARAMLRLRGAPSEPHLSWAATIGSGAHRMLQDALEGGDYLIEHRVTYKDLPATIDCYDPATKTLYDWKTVDGAAEVDKAQWSQKWLAQLMVGAAGLIEEGHEVEQVSIVVLPRSGNVLHAKLLGPIPFSRADADGAVLWRDMTDALALSDESHEAYQDEPAYFCRSFCPFVLTCRGPAPEQSDSLLPLEVAEAALAYRDAKDAEDIAKGVQKELRPLLDGYSGSGFGVKVGWSGGNPKSEDVIDVDALVEAAQTVGLDVPMKTVNKTTAITLKVSRT